MPLNLKPKRTILPSQIKHTILIHLYDIGDYPTLRACTLTSRDWLNAARRFTLRRLVFSRSRSCYVGERGGGGGGGREKMERVLRDGGLRDVVCPYVLELVVDLTRTAADSDDGDILGATTIPEWVYALLEVFLPRLHFLRTLSFRGLHLDSNSNAAFHPDEPECNGNDDRTQNINQYQGRIAKALSRVSRSTPIRALELSECTLDKTALRSLLGSMPNLTSLRILSPLLLPVPKQKREKGSNSTLDDKIAPVSALESVAATKMDASRTAMQLKELVYYDDTRDVSGQITLLTDLLSLSSTSLSFKTLQSLDVTLNSPSALLAVNTLLKICNETLRELKLRYPKGTKCWGRDRGYAEMKKHINLSSLTSLKRLTLDSPTHPATLAILSTLPIDPTRFPLSAFSSNDLSKNSKSSRSSKNPKVAVASTPSKNVKVGGNLSKSAKAATNPSKNAKASTNPSPTKKSNTSPQTHPLIIREITFEVQVGCVSSLKGPQLVALDEWLSARDDEVRGSSEFNNANANAKRNNAGHHQTNPYEERLTVWIEYKGPVKDDDVKRKLERVFPRVVERGMLGVCVVEDVES